MGTDLKLFVQEKGHVIQENSVGKIQVWNSGIEFYW